MHGTLFDSESSASRDVEVQLMPTGNLQLGDGRNIRHWALDQVEIAAPITGCPAVVELANGSRLEVADADAFYAALAMATGGHRSWVHTLERHWLLTGACLIISIALITWFMTTGIPLIARAAATAVPQSIHATIGAEGLALMDSHFFTPTGLSEERQNELQAQFDDITRAVGGQQHYVLNFRGAESIGPNAFALPDGIVVITDELIALAEDDGEIAAVLAHEVGHVVHHHVLRGLIQGSVSAGILVAMTGDLGSAANLAAGIPAAMVNAAYSRDFEREADDVAYRYLEMRGIDPEELGELLVRMDLEYGDRAGATTLLDSHPAARERLETARHR